MKGILDSRAVWGSALLVPRKNNLDFLRFVELKPLTVLFETIIAVRGFFIISGFLITKSWLTSRNPKRYFLNRAKRLLPGYISVVTICAFGLVFLSTLSPATYFSSPEWWRYLACNLLFANFLQPNLPGVFLGHVDTAVDGALWTIKIEVTFYLCLPFIMWALLRLKTKFATNVALVGIYVSAFVYRLLADYLFQATHVGWTSELSHQFPGFLSYFVFGMAMLLNIDVIQKFKNRLILPAGLAFGLHYLTGSDWLVAVSLGLIIFYVAFGLKGLNNFGKHGDFSYGIYIYHFPLIQIAVSVGLLQQQPYLFLVCMLVVVVVVGVLSWKLLGRRFLERHAVGQPRALP